MNKQQAHKLLTEATNEMARMTDGSPLHSQAKEKYTRAKKALNDIYAAEKEEAADTPEKELEVITERVEARKAEMIERAGINANSVIAGFASGSLSVQTEEETQRIYELKQEIMAHSAERARQARERILLRRANRKQKA